MPDIRRLLKKYDKIRKRYTLFFSLLYIIWFVVRDLLNDLLVRIVKIDNNISNIKNVLFVEPINQGYGDLFFQTSLFEFLHNSGFSINILTSKNHSQILTNNPNIKKIYYWKADDLFRILNSKLIIIGLGRSTLRETLLIITSFKSTKIILDKNIKYWNTIFENNSNTLAWNIIIGNYLNLEINNPVPKIFFSKLEKNIIKKERSSNKIGIIYGIENKEKRIDLINQIMNLIPSDKNILLFGKGNHYSGKRKVSDFINKISYHDTLVKIATCNTIIGAEGSLVQIAPSLGIKTIVLDPRNKFRENCHPSLLINTKILNNQNSSFVINGTLDQI